MEEELAESQDSPEDASADGDDTQMTESRKGDGQGGQEVRSCDPDPCDPSWTLAPTLTHFLALTLTLTLTLAIILTSRLHLALALWTTLGMVGSSDNGHNIAVRFRFQQQRRCDACEALA